MSKLTKEQENYNKHIKEEMEKSIIAENFKKKNNKNGRPRKK